MIVRNLLIAVMFLALFSCNGRQEFSQWRGSDRDGKYPQTGLLTEWPEEGPELLWSYEGLGAGHGSVSFANDQLFVLGMPDTMGIIYSFDLEGNPLWQKEYGPEWYANYTGPRSTPTVKDGLLYFISGQGVVFCMETRSGEIVWSVDMADKFAAQKTKWGIAESPLLDGDRIIVTPGGSEHNIVALDRYTGETIWSGKGVGEQTAYCSPILIQHNVTRLIITMTASSIMGIDAENGNFLWRIEHRQGNKINANSPLYSEGKVFCASGRADTLEGHVMIQLSEDGTTAEVGWRNQEWFNLMGGMIVLDGGLYSSSNRKKEFFCLDTETGNLNYVINELAGGVLISADSLFYLYGTDGVMALIDADKDSARVISSFKVMLGTDQHWAHPVIHQRKLYLHHGDALMCYDIAAKSSSN